MEDNIIILEDDQGNQVEFAAIDVFELNDNTYFALLEIMDNEESDEVLIMKVAGIDTEDPELVMVEDEAELQKRDDAAQIPIIRNTKGCLLTDASKIKSAKMTESGGKTTIVIVLNDEKNPLPAEEGATSCDSAVGSMMNPLSKKEIDNIVAEFSGVVTMNKFELTGKDCTATLVFDTASGKVESLEQIMNYFIEVDAKAVIVPVSGYATLTNKMTINNVTYK